MQTRIITGAEIVVECLEEQGVDCVFGYPGASILKLYDALYRFSKIRHCRTAHEQGAAHAADGYARATGRVGVCLATSGPGATNLVTGIAAAYMDSSPIVCITCNVKTSLIARDAFQEADITGITAPITKNNYIVSDVSELADTIREAFRVASGGRRGPVLVDINQDVLEACAEYFKKPPEAEKKPPFSGDTERAKELISLSQRPVILAGGGVCASGARAQISLLAKRIGAPVAATLMGLSAGLSGIESFVGMAGAYGEARARQALLKSDLIIACGTRFSDRLTDGIPLKKRIIHIDIDRAELGKNVDAELELCGDLREIIEHILQSPIENRAYWYEPGGKEAKPAARLTPASVMACVPEGAVVTTDVGLHQMYAAKYIKFCNERSFITSGGFGAMGFGLGAAIGAAFASPGRTVVNITGDGSFRMNLTELATVKENNLQIVTIVLDNKSLGMITHWQDKHLGGRRMASELSVSVDYAKVAEGYGILAETPKNAGELREAVKKACDSGKASVIICKIKG